MITSSRVGRCFGVACAVLVAAWLAGCGSSPVARGTGSLRVTIAWPTPSARLIPLNTASVVVTLTGPAPATTQVSQIANAPTGGGTTTLTFDQLLPGSYTVTVSSYSATNGGGTLLATGLNTETVAIGQTVTFPVTLASLVASVVVNLSNNAETDANPADTVTATLTAFDGPNGTGSVVPVAPGTVSWTSGNTAVANVATPGNPATITPVDSSVPGNPITLTITGTYSETSNAGGGSITDSATATLQVDKKGTGNGNVTVNRH
jgi:hypothetical protein